MVILFFKLSNPYKVSIYNYESYLNKEIVNKIKQNYSYHVFTNLDEFTRAIKNKKAVAGVSSDYQIAQLILEKKLKKINFQKAFNVQYDQSNKNKVILSLYSLDTLEQFNFYDKWIIDEIKKINPTNKTTILNNKNDNFIPFIYYENNKAIGFEIDGQEGIDNFYEFLIPYFTLDKMIVYNEENSEVYKTTRNNVVKNSDFSNVKDGDSWENILSKLSKKYKKPKFYWTNWFLDNAMIGQFYRYDSGFVNEKNNNGSWRMFDKNNYRLYFDSFNEFVEKTTGDSIKNVFKNKLVTDGQELVSGIIEPISGKADIAIMYNGDALDAYYGRDNFSTLDEDNNISFVRPKYTYKNIDAWIISSDTDDYDSDILLERLNKYIFNDVSKDYKDLHKQYILNVYNELMNNNPNRENNHYLTELFNENNFDKPKNIDQISKNFFVKRFEEFKLAFANPSLPNISNFDTINYTPSYKNIKNFLKDWYFLNKSKKIDYKALSIFDLDTAKNVEFRAYQPLDLELRTKMIDYYYQKTKS
ncbi:hypothetical protein [Metamycoplasma gateae]|uniref:Spermidine/putrescine ABC transporter substrate-binding protein n=1 Tax=Metamycoplasma gateae TaxID=35769 RepID=A0ABZ2AGS3_9BACT|nr:hypothetical protein V2E26_02760 [Metamycoplasma gateae]